MTVPGNLSSPLLATAADAAEAAGPTKSLRFNRGDSAHLIRTPSSAGNRRTFTISFWVKRTGFGTDQSIFSTGTSASLNGNTNIKFETDNAFRVVPFDLSGSGHELKTTAVLRDPSSFYHCVIAYDTTQATSSDRAKIYINGVEADLSTANYPSQNAELGVNSNIAQVIGRYNYATTNYLDAYLADFYLIDGSQLDATSFGAFDDNGVWQAAVYSGTYGTNGFHLLDFANEATVGHDSSGNNNDFTANNISENNNEAADFNAALSSTPFSDGSASSISITNTGSISTSSAGSNSFSISNAAEFTGGSNSGLTLGSAVDRTGLYTLDMYFKLDNLDQQMRLLTNESTTTGNALGAKEQGIAVATDGSLNVYDYGDPQLAPASAISANTWYHYRLIADGTTIKASYLNGTAQTTSGSIKNFAANTALRIGYGSTSVSHSTDGLIGPIRIVPGNLGAPPSGGLSTTSGALSNSAAAINLSPGVDVLFDVPTNGTQSDTGAGGEVSANYATFNPLSNGLACTVSEGNLQLSGSATSSARINGTIGVSSGKWYFEVTYTATDNYTLAGVGQDDITNQYPGQDAKSYAFDFHQGKKYNNGSQVTHGSSLSAGDIFMCALDLDNNKIFFGKNGTFFGSGNPATGANPSYTITAGTYHIVGRLNPSGFSSGNAIIDLNAGQRAYAYSAPTGFKSWNTTNLPTPTIADGSDYFDTKLYDGNGSTNAITGFEFSPDFVWLKRRSGAKDHSLFDTVRGVYLQLFTNYNNAEASKDTSLTSFDSNGFTLGSSNRQNENGYTNVAWAWDAGSSTASNTDGSITSSVRASQTSGFSVVSYTGSGSNATVGHGLNAALDFIIVKRRSAAGEWRCWHNALSNTQGIDLNSTGAAFTDDSFNDTIPTSSVFSLKGAVGNVNASSATYIAYCFTSVAGYSAFGSYEGNGSADGPFVYCGFKPRWIMMKNADTGGTYYDWRIIDTARHTYNEGGNEDIPPTLFANLNDAEKDWDNVDILSNGFKIKDSSVSLNQSGATQIFIAFAENPFSSNGGLAR